MKNWIAHLLYLARNFLCRDLFRILKEQPNGRVLDVGGWDFYLMARRRNIRFDNWTCLDIDAERRPPVQDEHFHFVRADGCRMPFADDQFDTVLNLQVLEHVFDPLRMVREVARVLKPGGRVLFLIPCRGALHAAPHHYYNFTRYWIEQACTAAGLRITTLQPIGGFWSAMASDLVYFFLKAFRVPGFTTLTCRRSPLFYILFPIMALYAVLSIPFCLLLSLADLTEEPNNHLVIAELDSSAGTSPA